MRRALLALLLSACGVPAPPPAAPPREAPATVLLGRVLTLDDDAPPMGAIRIEAGRITHVLAADDPALTGARIDLGEATIVPGLVDAHAHLLGIGRAEREVDLVGTGSIEEVVARVREEAARTPPGQWIRGRGWDQNDWPEPAFPTHAPLTEAFPDHPVLLRRVDGHAAWANARAMTLAGVDASTADPDGGELLRNDDGAPTGVFVDHAVDLVMRQLPPPTDAELRGDLARAMARCADAGLTGLHDMGMDARALAQLRALDAAGDMPIRVVVYLEGSDPGTDALLESPPDREGRLIVDGVKHYIDGALGSRGAALFEDYADRPGHRGLLLQSPEELAARARRAHAAGYRVAIHAIGDRGIATALEALGAAQGDDRSPRHRVEHVQILRLADLATFARLGITASMQPTHATSDMPWAEARVGPARIEGAYAWRRVLDAGVPLAFGSDAPVESYRPALGLYAAVTRQDADGRPESGWRPDQRVTVVEALRAFSRGAAAAIERDDLGVIRPGAVADLTVFAEDPTEVAPAALRALTPIATVVDGELRRVSP